MSERSRVLFLCTGNSCRSQMAEGWARHLHRDRLEARSAGVRPTQVNPLAVRVMLEAGVDLSAQRSKSVEEFKDQRFDWVVTVCDNARESCPHFANATRTVHVGFDDPPELARTARNDDEALALYRRVRDEIRAFIESWPPAD